MSDAGMAARTEYPARLSRHVTGMNSAAASNIATTPATVYHALQLHQNGAFLIRSCFRTFPARVIAHRTPCAIVARSIVQLRGGTWRHHGRQLMSL
jgi:hypothetical protein